MQPAFFEISSIFGDVFMDCLTRWISDVISQAGLPVYKMIFSAGTDLHAATADYLFKASVSTDNATLAAFMKEYYLSFVLELDPNKVSIVQKPYWPQYRNGYIININETAIGSRRDPDASVSCRFFQDQGSAVRNWTGSICMLILGGLGLWSWPMDECLRIWLSTILSNLYVIYLYWYSMYNS